MKKPTGLRAQASIIAVSILSAAGLAGAGEAHAGTYPMYALRRSRREPAAPTKAAWTSYDNVRRRSATSTRAARQPSRGGSYVFQINYPTGILQQNAGVGLELADPVERAAVGDLDRPRRRLDRARS